jgi:hypothetical protein
MNNQLNIGDTDTDSGIKYTVSNTNPETGQITWDVEYTPEFSVAFNLFNKLKNNLKDLHQSGKTDPELSKIAQNSVKSFNEFRTYLRKNHPSEYAKFKDINEGSIKQKLFKKITEMSTSSSSGGYNTKYAFKPQTNKPFSIQEWVKYNTISENEEVVNMDKMIKQQKGIDYKQLWKEYVLDENFNLEDYIQNLDIDDSKKKDFIIKRLVDFDEIEKKLNELIPLLQKAKLKSADKYKQNPNYSILYPTDLAQEYLDDLITLFKQ